MARACFVNSPILLLFAIVAVLDVSAQTSPFGAPGVGKPQGDPPFVPLTAAETEPQLAPAQSSPTQVEEKKQKAQKSDAQSKDKKGSWLFAPIPINSPAIGTGLQWVAARIFPMNKKDEISPPSTVGAGGIFTNNGSRAIVFGGKLYFKEDKYRVTTAFGTARINVDIYGVGLASGNKGVFVPMKTDGGGFFGEFLYRLKKDVYLGARGQYRNLSLSLEQDKLDSPDAPAQPPERVAEVIDQVRQDLLSQRTVSIGPRFQWDSRDSTFYPKQGTLLDVAADFFAEGLGSRWSYQAYKVGFNKYHGLGKYQVLAFRGMGCAATGQHVPIYDLCLFGSSNDIRGYPGGRFQDRRMFATQAEYRLMFPISGFLGRFGVVGFVGVGAVARNFSDLAWSDLLPGGGGGLRFRLTKKYPVNFRADYGVGKLGHTFTMGVLEAF